ncbi:alkaline phosphatase family protein [Kribbella sp. NBC_01245]|uniref:alkaline phosphatase family protein n=1 Tax=Kribbella sp. NBC_01245 TaxID=2903578 RepID=UPI002E2C71A6|nr:alkaline phosphatase family protein [Kribbella sp. NBC_01245]
MKRSAALFALATLTAATIAVPTSWSSPAAKTPKVVVIGIDGAMLSKIQAFDTPALKGLIASGQATRTSLYAQPFAPTLSGPGWATNATGVWPDKHKVKSNSWGTSTDLSRYPDFLTRLERAKPALSTYAIADWTPLTTNSAGQAIFSDEVQRKVTLDGDALGWAQADARIGAEAAAYLKDTGPDASFVYFGDVDIAGHSCGAAGACYRKALEQTDRHIGGLLAAVKARPTYADEEWTFLVTSDHGHTDAGGHGGNTPAERASYVISSAKAVGGAVKNVDIAPTVLAKFGITAAELDGRPIGTASSDPFDAVTLQPRVDETGIPADVLGWSQTTPAGWGIDNSAMGTGGMREWRGWSFTTDDFWTRTHAGQQRESNVRARGVFAVADSDEWSDKTRTGFFNSKLTSPAYDVQGAGKAVISSHYLKSGNEKASVLVSFDGGAAQTVLTYGGDVIAKSERLEVAVPSGASRMTVSWTLTNGDNDWYWAVDGPQVTKLAS